LDYHTFELDQFQLATQAIHRAVDQLTFKQLPAFLNEVFEDFYGFRDGLERARIRAAARTNRRNPFHLPYQRISALDQVIVGSRFKCFEPRDRVYAILGLLDPKVRQKIVVDYNKSVEEVYTDFAEVVIDTSYRWKSLQELGLVEGRLVVRLGCRTGIWMQLISQKCCDTQGTLLVVQPGQTIQ